MSKAEEIARGHFFEDHQYVIVTDLIAVANEALEWAAQQCEHAGVEMSGDPDNQYDGLDKIDIAESLTRQIRAGKSEPKTELEVEESHVTESH